MELCNPAQGGLKFTVLLLQPSEWQGHRHVHCAQYPSDLIFVCVCVHMWVSVNAQVYICRGGIHASVHAHCRRQKTICLNYFSTSVTKH